MVEDLKKHISVNLPFLEDKKVLIAISGGVDSVVLTHMLHKLNYNIALAHCNFQLRGKESDLDESFIKELSTVLNIQAFTISFDTKKYSKENKKSTQISARELRYDYFKGLIEKYGFDYVLTAHHADDNLETFLINLTRGTGLDGLTGIPVKNGNIIRPFLPFSRLSILKYAQENSIDWREDKSNAEKKYVRNKIRHKIIPVLKEINPNLLAGFNKTSAYLQENIAIVNDKIADLEKSIITKEDGVIKFNIKKILELSNPKAYLYQFLKDYNFNEWDKIYDLLTAQSGKYLRSNSYILLKNREFLVLSFLLKPRECLEKRYYIYSSFTNTESFPVKMKLVNINNLKTDDKNTILIDEELVVYPLFLKKKEEGDFFYPKGMFGKKKISKYFKDEKLSLLQKDNTWLLCSHGGEVIWVIGLRQDRRFETSSRTKKTLKISI